MDRPRLNLLVRFIPTLLFVLIIGFSSAAQGIQFSNEAIMPNGHYIGIVDPLELNENMSMIMNIYAGGYSGSVLDITNLGEVNRWIYMEMSGTYVSFDGQSWQPNSQDALPQPGIQISPIAVTPDGNKMYVINSSHFGGSLFALVNIYYPGDSASTIVMTTAGKLVGWLFADQTGVYQSYDGLNWQLAQQNTTIPPQPPIQNNPSYYGSELPYPYNDPDYGAGFCHSYCHWDYSKHDCICEEWD